MASVSAGMICSKCGSDEIDIDAARGDAACIACGTVVQQSLIVNEVGFQEDARGRSNMVGQHVRADGRGAFSSLPGYTREATEQTMAGARRRLSQLASQLRLANRFVEKALRLYRIAVERNFHRGRKTVNLTCACLYIVCRIERSPHMLLDFSDATRTNLYDLGHTYLKLIRVLSVSLPIIDPSLYMHRFAAKLEYGDKTHAVAMTALRVAARMQRDWMTQGRRPAGLCGAALITASIMHNFYRSQTEIAKVVRIGNVTLRQRLRELHRTSTASLTPAQIDAGGGDDGQHTSLVLNDVTAEACDPPAFQRLQMKKARLAEEAAAREKENAEKTKDAENTTGAGKASAGTEKGSTGPDEASGNTNAKAPSAKKGLTADGKTVDDERINKLMEDAMSSKEMRDLDDESNVEEGLAAAAAAEAAALQNGETPSMKSGGDTNKATSTTAEEWENDNNADLSDLDDEDTAKYISTEAEYERKKELWTESNKEYLEKQERLETMKRERPEDYKRLRPSRAPKKRRVTVAGTSLAKNAETEEVEEVVASKPSKKLNYAVLKSLGESGDLGDFSTPSAHTTEVTAPSGSTRVSI